MVSPVRYGVAPAEDFGAPATARQIEILRELKLPEVLGPGMRLLTRGEAAWDINRAFAQRREAGR